MQPGFLSALITSILETSIFFLLFADDDLEYEDGAEAGADTDADAEAGAETEEEEAGAEAEVGVGVGTFGAEREGVAVEGFGFDRPFRFMKDKFRVVLERSFFPSPRPRPPLLLAARPPSLLPLTLFGLGACSFEGADFLLRRPIN